MFFILSGAESSGKSVFELFNMYSMATWTQSNLEERLADYTLYEFLASLIPGTFWLIVFIILYFEVIAPALYEFCQPYHFHYELSWLGGFDICDLNTTNIPPREYKRDWRRRRNKRKRHDKEWYDDHCSDDEEDEDTYYDKCYSEKWDYWYC